LQKDSRKVLIKLVERKIREVRRRGIPAGVFERRAESGLPPYGGLREEASEEERRLYMEALFDLTKGIPHSPGVDRQLEGRLVDGARRAIRSDERRGLST
jgi:hypothetical protein